jgi:RNA polymerase primary sigma factor
MGKSDFLQQALSHEVLTLEQEKELKNKLPDDKYKERLVLNNLKFAYSFSNKYAFKFKNSHLTSEDFFSVCCNALVKAAESFEIKHNVKFYSYASIAILNACNKYVTSNLNQLHISCSTQRTFNKIKAYKQEFKEKFGRFPKESTLKKALGVTSEMLLAYKTRLKVQEQAFELADTKDRLEIIKNCLEILSEREKDIIVKNYGLFGEDRVNLANIGKKHKLTRERVRQLRNIALSKIQKLFKQNEIKDIL